MQIDDPAVLAEARAVFDRYELAIAENDAAVLDDSFWADPRTVRFGTTEILYGIEAIRAFRASVARYAPRATRRVQITGFGRDFACTHLEYQRTDSGLIGRETKIMARLPGLGWKVVSAHVSLLAGGDPGRVAREPGPGTASVSEKERSMAGRIEARLKELGITLPAPAAPVANYIPFNRTGNLVVVSGQIPLRDGKIAYTGKLGAGVSVEQGQAAARLCFINLVAQVKAACEGDLDRVRRVVRLGGFIAAPGEFTQHAVVMNGASDLAVEVFGEAGRHARTTIGVPSLPGDAAVEVEGMFEIG
jgi:enamine deaminase RidA (YjgF/YER057c/UK114 family)